MKDFKDLTKKTVKTLREDGFHKVGQKARLYLKRNREAKSEGRYTDGCFRDVLFVNGCNESLPHPGRYRVTHQREQLESLGITTGEVYFQNLQIDTLRCYRIIIFFRCPYTDLIGNFVELAREMNKTILYDVDDLVIDTVYTDMIPYLDTMEEKQRKDYDANVRSMGKLLRLCDGAITTTSCLAQELEQYVPEVFINRNVASEEMVQLSLQALEQQKVFRVGTEPDTVRIGYFSGSITHNDDFQMILSVLVSLLKDYPKLQLHVVGELDVPEELSSYTDQIITHPFSDWRELPAVIARVDINLAPLTSNTFNRAKSENKWVEAALVKVPTVASDIGAFHEMVENGRTGILCQNTGQWEEALRALIEQPSYRELIGQAAFDYCREYCVTARTGTGLAEFLRKRQKENIAFILPSFQVSGGVMVALQHARILRKTGRDVLLLSIDERGKEKWYDFENCRFPVINCADSRFLGTIDQAVATMWSTVDYLERIPSIQRKCYLVQNYEPDFYDPGDPLRLQARKTYGFHPQLHYLTISKWCRDWLSQRFGHEVSYAPTGLDPDKFTEKERTMDGKIRILIEGDSTAQHKNVDESFRIVELLDKEKYEVWYMAYHGTPKDWYRVDKFLSQVPYEQVQDVYEQCDILLKSSLLESFSYPPLEMMAAGGYVVAVKNAGNSEYLEDGVNCLTYPAGDIARGAEAIGHICRDEQLRRHLRENGRRTADSRAWQELREEIVNLYQN